MLTLTAVAIFPIAFVSYVIVRDEVRNVTRTIDFEVHDAAQNAQARFSRLLDRRQLRAVTAATSPTLQAAIGRTTPSPLVRSSSPGVVRSARSSRSCRSMRRRWGSCRAVPRPEFGLSSSIWASRPPAPRRRARRCR
jgi:hypothetical protein